MSFAAKKPTSFTAKIDFLDAEGNRFSLPVSGTSDNSLCTVYPFVATKGDAFRLMAGEGRPIMLVEKASEEACFLYIRASDELGEVLF